MEIQAAVAKVQKYATSESGDTLEIIERPHGGLSLVLADGQRSGRAAKTISNLVARKAISLLAEGVRDGAAARAAHDYLYANRGGKVSATLNIVSVDLVTKTAVISRNSHCPVIVADHDGTRALDAPSQPVASTPAPSRSSPSCPLHLIPGWSFSQTGCWPPEIAMGSGWTWFSLSPTFWPVGKWMPRPWLMLSWSKP
jgi:hypothetical protein